MFITCLALLSGCFEADEQLPNDPLPEGSSAPVRTDATPSLPNQPLQDDSNANGLPPNTDAKAGEPNNKTEEKPRIRRIVFLGDSLMDAPGIQKHERYPERIGEALRAEHPDWIIENKGIGGNTTADGLARIEAALEKADILFVCLGGNDFLRNLESQKAKENLTQIIQLAKKRGVYPVLAGLKGPAIAKFVGTISGSWLPNQNPAAYETMYDELAKDHTLPFLEDITKQIPKASFWQNLTQFIYFDPAYMVDTIHPNAKGHQLIAEHVFRFLSREIARFEAKQKPIEGPARPSAERVFTVYLLGTASNSNDYQNADFWDGETVSSIGQMKQAGKDYLDYLVVDGPGSGARQYKKRFKHFGDPSPFEHSSGQVTGYGVIENIENVVAVLKLENENPALHDFVASLKQDLAQSGVGPVRVVNIIGWSRGAVSGIVLSRYLSRDPLFKEVRVNIFAIDPVAGPFWSKDTFQLDDNVDNYMGVYAENEYSQGFEAIVPTRAKSNTKTKIGLYSVPGKHATLVGADWGNSTLRSVGKLVRGLAEEFLTSHGSRFNSPVQFNTAARIALVESIKLNKSAYFELGRRESATTNRDVNSLSGPSTTPVRETYLGLDETVCTFGSLCGEYLNTTLSHVPNMISLLD